MNEERDYAKILMGLGIRPNIKGYYYLLDILTAEGKPDVLYSAMKKMYKPLAQKHEATESQIERSIRHAVDMAYKMESPLWKRLFPTGEKPSNSYFMAMLKEALRLKLIDEGELHECS